MPHREAVAAKRIREDVTNLGHPDKKIARRAEDSLIRYYEGERV